MFPRIVIYDFVKLSSIVSKSYSLYLTIYLQTNYSKLLALHFLIVLERQGKLSEPYAYEEGKGGLLK